MIGGTSWKCPYCSYSSVVQRNARRHLKRNHCSKPFRLISENREKQDNASGETNKSNINQGRPNINQEKPKKSNISDGQSENPIGKQRSIVVHKDKAKCTKCNFAATGMFASTEATMHFAKEHTKGKVIVNGCSYCKFSSFNKRSLVRHQLRKHPNKPANAILRKVLVSKKEKSCDSSAKSKDFNGKKLFHCPYCKFSSLYQHSAIRHCRFKHPRNKARFIERKEKQKEDNKYSQIDLKSVSSDLYTYLPDSKVASCSLCTFQSTGLWAKQQVANHIMKFHQDNPVVLLQGTQNRRSSQGTMSPSTAEDKNKGMALTIKRPEKNEALHRSIYTYNTNIKKGKCNLCDYTNSGCHSKRNIRRHAKIHIVRNTQKCHHCSFITNHVEKLIHHMNSTHQKQAKPLVMARNNIKEKVFEIEVLSQLPKDLDIDENSLFKFNVKENLFQCRKCSFSHIAEVHVKDHIVQHTEGRLWGCPYCDMKSNNKSSVKGHVRKMHPGHPSKIIRRKPWDDTGSVLDIKVTPETVAKDGTIAKASTNISSSKLPKLTPKIVQNVEVMVLDYTPSEFLSDETYYTYITSKQEYKCKNCSYSNTQFSAMRDHILIHSGGKVWGCPYCEEKCNKKQRMMLHVMDTHPSEHLKLLRRRPFINKAVGEARNNIIKASNYWQCGYCNRKSDLKTTMTTHIMFAHPRLKPIAPIQVAHSNDVTLDCTVNKAVVNLVRVEDMPQFPLLQSVLNINWKTLTANLEKTKSCTNLLNLDQITKITNNTNQVDIIADPIKETNIKITEINCVQLPCIDDVMGFRGIVRKSIKSKPPPICFDNRFQCSKCDKCFDSLTDVKSHTLTFHPESVSQYGPFSYIIVLDCLAKLKYASSTVYVCPNPECVFFSRPWALYTHHTECSIDWSVIWKTIYQKDYNAVVNISQCAGGVLVKNVSEDISSLPHSEEITAETDSDFIIIEENSSISSSEDNKEKQELLEKELSVANIETIKVNKHIEWSFNKKSDGNNLHTEVLDTDITQNFKSDSEAVVSNQNMDNKDDDIVSEVEDLDNLVDNIKNNVKVTEVSDDVEENNMNDDVEGPESTSSSQDMNVSAASFKSIKLDNDDIRKGSLPTNEDLSVKGYSKEQDLNYLQDHPTETSVIKGSTTSSVEEFKQSKIKPDCVNVAEAIINLQPMSSLLASSPDKILTCLSGQELKTSISLSSEESKNDLFSEKQIPKGKQILEKYVSTFMSDLGNRSQTSFKNKEINSNKCSEHKNSAVPGIEGYETNKQIAVDQIIRQHSVVESNTTKQKDISDNCKESCSSIAENLNISNSLVNVSIDVSNKSKSSCKLEEELLQNSVGEDETDCPKLKKKGITPEEEAICDRLVNYMTKHT